MWKFNVETNSTHKMMKGCYTLSAGGLWVKFENSNFETYKCGIGDCTKVVVSSVYTYILSRFKKILDDEPSNFGVQLFE